MAVKVLQVAPSYYPAFVYGGPIFSIHYACQALARQGVEVHVATTNANGSTKLDVPTKKAVAFEPHYSVHYYDDTIIGRFSLAFTLNLWRDIKAAQIVHLQDVFSTHAAWTLLLAILLRKPVLVSARGTFTSWGLTNKRPWAKKTWIALLVRPFVRANHRIAWHATSKAERGEILAQFPEGRVHIVPNGIDCTAFDAVRPLSRADYFARFFPQAHVAPDRARVLAGMGRLHSKKSFDTAIRAFHTLAQTNSDMVLMIAGGDDGAREPLDRLIGELGLGDRIALVGEVRGADKIAFLKGADIFLFPSHSENFGMTCLEALAAGLPVVASRNTPWAEVEAVGSGRWVENTPEAFAKAMADLMERELSGMRLAARAQATHYDLAAIAAAFAQIYRELIDANYS